MEWQAVMSTFVKIKPFLLDLFFPIECLGCGGENKWLCQRCQEKIKLKAIDECLVCKETTGLGKTHEPCRTKTFLDGVMVAAAWEDKLLQGAIHKYKYNFVTGLAEPLADILIKKMNEPERVRLFEKRKIILVPVPLHKKRLNWRGFNQAELLTKKISSHFGWGIQPMLLLRQRYTKPQVKLKKEKRAQNIQGAFGIKPGQPETIKDALVILVDDVLTTGATMNECAKILKENGIKEVWGLALARG
ncbi:hypothetical protein A3H03_01765 [Candidatus Kuenenbacteria bacterium RIFCSPLOWO2_12_FULL_42_13]|uniref:Phosphoribosyltransferase domain-containing protein n=1 Tax=Candidatus Kuenenbacteria bacterium RIFCSPLOWO2_12_FULL_42_13 TaxID=1798565 RepID=A0A1F6FZF6_9BACT|nr:MAG: hypothetical protein A3H03_01765 [Candidatus Kuenenbacteria bacterium RIFCSPLOWO2_12_FULL_42_13]